MPSQLRDFDPVAWGWSGPHYVDEVIVPGYREAWRRFLAARLVWCDQHPVEHPIEDVLRRHPDEPWGVSA